MKAIKRLVFAGISVLFAVNTFLVVPVAAQGDSQNSGGSGITIEEFYRTNDIYFYGEDRAVAAECSGGGSTQLRGGATTEQAFNFFVDNGFNPDQSAGIVGNLIKESGDPIDPEARNGSVARGIAQWGTGVDGSRWSNLEAFANERGEDPNSLGLQLEFIMHELENPGNGSVEELKGTSSLEDATFYFANQYERCAACGSKGTSDVQQRIDFAKQVLARYGSGGSSDGGGDSGGSTGSSSGCEEGGGAGSGDMVWPVKGQSEIQSCFGPRPQIPQVTGGFHYGIDIGADVGTEIVAAADGTVTAASPGPPLSPNYVSIDHEGLDVSANYGHMSSYSVSKGDKVKQGQTIGKVGFANTAHLHLTVMPLGQDFAYTQSKPGYDPAKYLQKPADVPNNSINGGCEAFK